MAENSKIEWCHDSANAWWGCVGCSPGCDNCYAEVLSHRWGNDLWGNDKPRRMIMSFTKDLVRFQNKAKVNNEIRRVFVGSMMDIFEKPMPVVNIKGKPLYGKIGNGVMILSETKPFGYIELNTGHLRDQFFHNITAGEFPNLMFLLLTKRPSNINKYIPESWKTNPPDNVMFGTSPVNQATANTLIPQLLKVKGKKFLSCEPMLGKIYIDQLPMLDWVIVGGESGHGKRPFDSDWARYIRNQCEAVGTPFFMKQIDKVLPIPEDLLIREWPIYGECIAVSIREYAKRMPTFNNLTKEQFEEMVKASISQNNINL